MIALSVLKFARMWLVGVNEKIFNMDGIFFFGVQEFYSHGMFLIGKLILPKQLMPPSSKV